MKDKLDYAMEVIRPKVKSMGVWFDSGDYNLNLVAERARDTEPGKFDDRVWCVMKRGGVWEAHAFQATADPGLVALRDPSNKHKVARLAAGQYRSAWAIGKHKGKYPALRQRRAVTVERHRPGRNWQREPETETGFFGINWHCAAPDPFGSIHSAPSKVGKWSEGCVVIRNQTDYCRFWALILEAGTLWGNSFTGTIC